MAALLILVFCALAHVATCELKNILFLAVDDLRPELGTYGYDMIKSPNIDSLASKSIVFERAYCQVGVCSPSRASLLTGRRPDSNHVWRIATDEYWRTTTNATSIPQYFKENGYISIGMGKIFHPGAPSGNDDEKYSWSPESLPYYHAPDNAGHTYGSWNSFEGYRDNQLPDGAIGDRAVSVIQQLKKNSTNGDKRPFFLAVGFHKPHLPFYAPSKYYDLYPPAEQIPLPLNPDAPKDMPDIAFSVWVEIREYSDIRPLFDTECVQQADAAINGKECQMPESKMRELRRAYYSCISYTDAQIGRVVKELEAQGFANNTVIVFWGDHGWQLGEHNEWCKQTNFEDAVRVPFLIHVPGVTDKGKRTKALVELIDIFPTLTELSGIQTPDICPEGIHNTLACVEGVSVASLIQNPDQSWKRAAFSQYPRPAAGLHTIPGHPPFSRNEHQESVMGYTMRTDDYRFTEWVRFDRTTATPMWNETWGTELYDHSQPSSSFNDENVNLANNPDMKDKVEELRKQLRANWRAVLPR